MNHQIQRYHTLQQAHTEKLWLIDYLRHWLTSITEFDSMTYEANSINLVDLCQQSLAVGGYHAYDHALPQHDLLYHVVKHIFGNNLNLLLNLLNTKIVREHEIMPLVNAREFDTLCMQWVARKSGRNLKEKLSLDNKVLGVKRRQNYDTLENRLLKALLTELQYLFDQKQSAFALSEEDNGELEFLEKIETWLLSDEAYQIGRWQNLPPNNTLLQHKYYKKVWYSWQFLQRIDDILEQDEKNYVKNTFTTLHFQFIARLTQFDEIRIPQSPIAINYEYFTIISAIDSHCVKGYLVNDSQNQGYFTLTIYETYYQVAMFDNTNNIQFDIICHFNPKQDESLFIFEFAIKGGDWKTVEFQTINDLIIQIMGAFKHWLSAIPERVLAITSQQAIINLSHTQISVFDGKKYHHLSKKLLAQIWDNHGEKDTIYVGHANALYVSENVQTYALTHALESNKTIQNDIIPTLIKSLADTIDCKKITCIHSDKFDDFSLQVLKQSLNSAFPSANLLPQSIATAFALLEQNPTIQANASFVAIAVDNHAITFTLLKSNEDKELTDTGYRHVIWERYPAETLSFTNNFEEYLTKSIEPKYVHIIANNFSPTEIKATQLSLITAEDCQHLEELTIDEHEIRIEQTAFDKIYQTLEQFVKTDSQIKFLVTPETQHVLPKKYKNRLVVVEHLERGANFLLQHQEKLGELGNKLWRDHLPYMGIRVRTATGYGKFDLVKDVAITPKRGQRIEIPVVNEFTLPKNQTSYQFPLYLGNKDKANAFQATLISPLFPLSQDTDCQVRLYYTYGAEQPYELYFIPTGRNEKIKAKWEVFDDSNVVYPVPDYPTPLTIQELETFESKWGTTTNLLLESMKVFDVIINMGNAFNSIPRMKGTIKKIAQAKGFMFLTMSNGQEIFLHIKDFIENIDILALNEGDEISFELTQDKNGRAKAIHASINLKYPSEFYKNKLNERYFRRIKRNQFAIYTISNDARLLNSLELFELQEKYKQAVDAIHTYRALKNFKQYNELNLVFQRVLQCNYHYITPQFLTDIKSTLMTNKYEVEIAYLLGDISQDWQQDIFKYLIDSLQKNKIQPKIYQVFGIAFWRYSELINNLSNAQVYLILEGLVEVIEDFIKKSRVKNSNFYAISKYWQLVLALLRLRNRTSIKHILSPTNELIEKLTYLLSETESLVQLQESNNKKFRTYIEFALEKPQDEPSSDFFYALRLYLAGDDGANAIRIKVNQED